jgi:AcrR family transcriptional regulator
VSSSKVLRSKSVVRESYHHGDLQAALLEAAVNLVRANGPDHLSLRAVAEQVGVSPSAVYHYFPDKDSLISELGDQLFIKMAEMQAVALGSIPGNSARAARMRYRELGRTYFRWANSEPNLFRLMFGGFCKIEKRGTHESEEAFLMLSKCLDDLLATGVITPTMRKYGELISWSAVQGASTLIIEGILPEEAFEELLDGLELAMRGGAK